MRPCSFKMAGSLFGKLKRKGAIVVVIKPDVKRASIDGDTEGEGVHETQLPPPSVMIKDHQQKDRGEKIATLNEKDSSGDKLSLKSEKTDPFEVDPIEDVANMLPKSGTMGDEVLEERPNSVSSSVQTIESLQSFPERKLDDSWGLKFEQECMKYGLDYVDALGECPFSSVTIEVVLSDDVDKVLSSVEEDTVAKEESDKQTDGAASPRTSPIGSNRKPTPKKEKKRTQSKTPQDTKKVLNEMTASSVVARQEEIVLIEGRGNVAGHLKQNSTFGNTNAENDILFKKAPSPQREMSSSSPADESEDRDASRVPTVPGWLPVNNVVAPTSARPAPTLWKGDSLRIPVRSRKYTRRKSSKSLKTDGKEVASNGNAGHACGELKQHQVPQPAPSSLLHNLTSVASSSTRRLVTFGNNTGSPEKAAQIPTSNATTPMVVGGTFQSNQVDLLSIPSMPGVSPSNDFRLAPSSVLKADSSIACPMTSVRSMVPFPNGSTPQALSSGESLLVWNVNGPRKTNRGNDIIGSPKRRGVQKSKKGNTTSSNPLACEKVNPKVAIPRLKAPCSQLVGKAILKQSEKVVKPMPNILQTLPASINSPIRVLNGTQLVSTTPAVGFLGEDNIRLVQAAASAKIGVPITVLQPPLTAPTLSLVGSVMQGIGNGHLVPAHLPVGAVWPGGLFFYPSCSQIVSHVVHVNQMQNTVLSAVSPVKVKQTESVGHKNSRQTKGNSDVKQNVMSCAISPRKGGPSGNVKQSIFMPSNITSPQSSNLSGLSSALKSILKPDSGDIKLTGLKESGDVKETPKNTVSFDISLPESALNKTAEQKDLGQGGMVSLMPSNLRVDSAQVGESTNVQLKDFLLDGDAAKIGESTNVQQKSLLLADKVSFVSLNSRKDAAEVEELRILSQKDSLKANEIPPSSSPMNVDPEIKSLVEYLVSTNGPGVKVTDQKGQQLSSSASLSSSPVKVVINPPLTMAEAKTLISMGGGATSPLPSLVIYKVPMGGKVVGCEQGSNGRHPVGYLIGGSALKVESMVCSEEASIRVRKRKNTAVGRKWKGTEESLRGKRLRCGVCSLVFFNMDAMDEHLLQHARISWHWCTHCWERFKHKNELKYHIHGHIGAPPPRSLLTTQCELCGVSVLSRNFSAHLSVHQGSRPFDCNHCGKSFRTKEHLKSHLNCHSEERAFECHICGKKLKRKPALHSHLQLHTHQIPQFPCVECGRAFPTQSRLNIHMVTHSDERNYPCAICGKCFKTEAVMQSHEKGHLRKLRLPCPQCALVYQSRVGLRKHQKKNNHW
ncbi:uncharacterized protein LOC124154628 isoform X2 [Ischnura elegans]|uniref:uncharacterized protein LOC124154628 isoform X2 n=1 Tax=Ischnura elegans TaxID=197161 RepID=UPI001ED87561|nr:uncharacterized protein LOC124154628 isoform X2 [Ischnura elegans]